ncbi:MULTISPECIES: hypothetical protein [unclassified Thiocapsa]|uniref:hypothetical protein n=1 Tax=unclassified Thiocapsa TaxID=2641286 RepID=UPI0035B2859A
MEQRIGRIHRYGQKDTAQVYNLVLSDTIEGRIFLLLNDKLNEIARTLGKVDEHGNVTEDLRGQILGQLNDRLSYDQLYREALSDPELKRTREELEAAMSNAREARRVVFELFQDLDRFSLDDYKPLADIDAGKARLVAFLRAAVEDQGGRYREIDACRFELTLDAQAAPILCTLDRDLAQTDDTLVLMGLDHPILGRLSERWRSAPPSGIGAVAKGDLEQPIVLSVWWVQSFGGGSGAGADIIPIPYARLGLQIAGFSDQRLQNGVFLAREVDGRAVERDQAQAEIDPQVTVVEEPAGLGRVADAAQQVAHAGQQLLHPEGLGCAAPSRRSWSSACRMRVSARGSRRSRCPYRSFGYGTFYSLAGSPPVGGRPAAV